MPAPDKRRSVHVIGACHQPVAFASFQHGSFARKGHSRQLAAASQIGYLRGAALAALDRDVESKKKLADYRAKLREQVAAMQLPDVL